MSARRPARERGSVLFAVMVALALVAVLAYTLADEAVVDTQLVLAAAEANQAGYVAEAGLQHALWQANQSGCTGYGLPDQSFGPHGYSVSFDVTEGSPVAIASMATLASGTQATRKASQARVYEPPTTVVLQLGSTPGGDTLLDNFWPTRNYGGVNYLTVNGDTGGWLQWPLLRFDVSSIPAGATILSARLELRQSNCNAGGPVTAHRITRDWVEGTKLGGGQADGATWLTHDGTSSWAVPGGEYAPEVSGEQTVVAGTSGWVAWEIAPLVSEWVAGGAPNHGVLLKNEGTVRNAQFASSQASNAPDHPKLIIEYTCECGTGCVAGPTCSGDFEPSGRVASWPYGSGNSFDSMRGITWVPEGFELDGVAAPAGGAFVAVDWGDDSFTMYDRDGAILSQSLPTPTGSMNGVAYVSSGSMAGRLAVAQASPSASRIYLVDPTGGGGTVVLDIGAFASKPSGVAFIERSASGTYDEHLAVSDRNDDALYLIDTGGNLAHTITPAGGVGELHGVVHLPGTDRFLTVDTADDLARVVDVDGVVTGSFNLANLGLPNAYGVSLDPEACEQVVANDKGAAGSDVDEVVRLGDTGGTLGPIAHWKLDDGTGITAIDSSGNGHDGTLAGDPAWVVGVSGDALDFDGAGDRVDADAVLAAGSPVISVTAWVNKRDSGDDRAVCKSTGTNIPDHVFCLGVFGQTVRVRLRTTDNGGTSNYDGGNINLDEWTHLGFSYDGSTLRIYQGGAEAASYAVTGDVIASGQPVALGNVNAVHDRYWNGLLDDVRIYDRALSAAEIASLAAGGGGGGGCNGTFRDEFNDDALGYGGSDGTEPWATDWLEINESDGPTGGDERVVGSPGFHVQVQDNDGGGEGVEREADLSDFSSATLSFTYRREGLDNANDYVTVDVSSDGGGNWTELDRFAGSGTDADFIPVSYDITSFISSQTRIRFFGSTLLGSSDRVRFDDVEIAVSGCAGP